VAQSLILLFVRAYYAGGKTWPPLIINISSSAVIIVSAIIFNHLFATEQIFREFLEALLRTEGLSGTSILFLPLAFSVGTFLNLVLLWFFFGRHFGVFPRLVWRGAGQSFGSSILGGAVAYLCLNLIAPFLDQNTFVGIFSQGLISGIFGLLTIVLLLKLMANEELEELSVALTKKFWRARPVAPSPEEI
jgi:peptidoglycan biosynthesis protein MviN/MurJ (putative lipid II flippase)